MENSLHLLLVIAVEELRSISYTKMFLIFIILPYIDSTIVVILLVQGNLMKRGYLLPTMREYWFVLQPTQLAYYKSMDERELCG